MAILAAKFGTKENQAVKMGKQAQNLYQPFPVAHYHESHPARSSPKHEMAKKDKATPNETNTSSPRSPSYGGGGEKEGSFLLGQPTFADAGLGRWRCTESGHELPEREKEAYARSRACRVALIDYAVAHNKPPLNAFKPHPEHKSKLICKITGDTINKTEEHIWKHINGKRFLNKLEQIELEKMAMEEVGVKESEQLRKVPKESRSSGTSKKKDKKEVNDVRTSLPRDSKPEVDDSDDPEFWMPPVGSRWDNDDGKDRWKSSAVEDNETENAGSSGDMADKDDPESGELASSRTKRMSIEVGPSSFASRKKKPKKG